MTDLITDNQNGEKPSLRSIVLGGLAFLFFAAGLIVSLVFLLHASLKQDSFTHELGDAISDDPGDYIEAGFLAMRYGSVDLSGIDASKCGEYEIIIKCPGKTFTAPFILEDTTAPVISLFNRDLCFAAGTRLSPSDLVRNVKDADSDVDVFFDEDSNDPDALKCKNTGSYSAWLKASDSSGNETSVCIPYTVDLPPEFKKMCDLYVAAGSTRDLLKYVRAYDETDGDLSDEITMYPAEPELTEGTEAELKFTVTDSFGLKTTETVNLYVKSPEDLQSLIEKRTITRENAIIIGAINEYDTGLFNNRSIEQTLIDVMPTVVSIRVDEKSGSSTTGSGFIIQITDTDIFIVTNHHVVNSNTECDICFYTSDQVKGRVMGYSDYYDVAVIKVSLKDLPEKFSDIISTVHIDMTYWNKIKEGDKVELGLERMTMDGTIEHYTYGLLVSKLRDVEFFTPRLETEMNLKLKLGDSGSAVFDKKGRLICMAFAYSISPERDWAIPLPEIIEAYEEISGNELYVY